MTDKIVYIKRYQKKKIKNGICLYGGCNEKASKGRQHCDFHRRKIRKINKKYYFSHKPSRIRLPNGNFLLFKIVKDKRFR